MVDGRETEDRTSSHVFELRPLCVAPCAEDSVFHASRFRPYCANERETPSLRMGNCLRMLNKGPLCVHLRIPKDRPLAPANFSRTPGHDLLQFLVTVTRRRALMDSSTGTSVSPADVQQVAIDAALLWRHERPRGAPSANR